ncbi:MAG: YesL family protein [Candidatus Faecousia sp.]|nr:YesL family protein [Candidatus Faecousia sp.]
MRNLFNYENPFIQFLVRVGDLIILNVLFILCSAPVVTLGASLTALHRVTQNMLFEQEEPLLKAFFRAFRQNFKQSTLAWLVELVVIVSLVCDVLLVMAYFNGGLAKAMYILVAVLAILVAGVYAYLMPLIARYENGMRQQVNNAVILAIIKLPKTLLLVFLNLLPVILVLISVPVFVQTLIFWVVIGFAFVSFIESSILKPVFQQLEKGNESVTIG